VTDYLTKDPDYLNALAHLNLAEKSAGVWKNNKKTDAKKFPALIKEVADGIRLLEYTTISEYNNQIWEISSGLLFAFERLQNLGIEQLREGQRKNAQEHFGKAYELYNLFVELNQKLSLVKSPKAVDTKAAQSQAKKSGKIVGKLKGLVQAVIDCCIE
jgi:hypothetical protein